MFIKSSCFSGSDDLRGMLDLLIQVRPADRITDFPGLVDLHELLAQPLVQANTRLWFDAARKLVGFALVNSYHNLVFEVDPRAMHSDLEDELVAWGQACLRRAGVEGDEALALDASCRQDDADRIAFLTRHGFIMQAVRSLRMLRSLDEPIPTPRLPAGFSIRPVAGEHEAAALAALHRAAFGTDHMTVEERLAMMRVPGYDPHLDLLAVAPDGRLAAACMCSISPQQNQRSGRNEGSTDPILTHPDFQRLGSGQGAAAHRPAPAQAARHALGCPRHQQRK